MQTCKHALFSIPCAKVAEIMRSLGCRSTRFRATVGRSNSRPPIDEERRSASSVDVFFTSSCRKFTYFATSAIRFRSRDKSLSCCGRRRHRIRQHHHTAYGVCFQGLPSLLSTWKRVLDWESSHCSDRFQRNVRHRSAPKERRRIDTSLPDPWPE